MSSITKPPFHSTFLCSESYIDARKSEGMLDYFVTLIGGIADKFFKKAEQSCYIIFDDRKQISYEAVAAEEIGSNIGVYIIILLTGTIALWILLLGKIAFHRQIARSCAGFSVIRLEGGNNQIEDKVESAQKILDYPGDLSFTQEITSNFVDSNTLKITFKNNSNFNVTIRKQDIFKSGADVIVNSANTYLGGGGGIDGAIHKKGGTGYKKAHEALKIQYNEKYPSGLATMIASGSLRWKYGISNVIVVAGPKEKSTPTKDSQLYSCYYNSLMLAHNRHEESIAFPSISTGIYKFPQDKATAISLRAISDFITNYPESPLKTISIHFLPTDPLKNLEQYHKSLAD